MTWKPLARREARVHVKETGTWIIGVLLVGFYLLSYSSISDLVSDVLGADAAVLSLQVSFANALLIGGLLLGHRAVLDERTTGRIKLTASMPHSRRDIIVGKVVGLAIPLVALVIVLLLVATGIAVVTNGIPSLGRLVLFGLVSVVYAVVCAGLGVALSSVATTAVRVTGGMLLSLGTLLLWNTPVTMLYARLTGTSINLYQPPADGVLFLVRRLDPRSTYFVVTNWLYDVGNAAGTYDAVVAELHAEMPTITNVWVVNATFERAPSYLAEPFGIVIMLVWLLPLAVAARSFENADIP